jgi:MoaA/NifB/PqqE/SkfB family radical SAM enzyme
MKQLARLEYLARHLLTFMPYLTAAKIGNLILNAVELRLAVVRPRSLPPYLKIEPTPLCQMACSGCAHGDRDKKRALFHNRQQLRLEDFKKILEPLKHTTLGISLSLRGEPLLGKELLSIVEYAHACGIAVSFPSNLSVKLSDEKLTRLVTSGLDALYVSLDGASAGTYSQYRIGGDFQRVVDNVRAIADVKLRLRQARPRLVWKFVVFEHNRHEIPLVEKRYRDMGFDSYELVQDYTSAEAKLTAKQHNSRLVTGRKPCYWAWHTSVIRADGAVAPCCLGQHKDFGLGVASTQNFAEIWRGAAYSALRRGFATMAASDLHPACAHCLGVSAPRKDVTGEEELIAQV